MDDLIDSGAEAVSDPDGALMVVSAINSIIGGEGGVRSYHISEIIVRKMSRSVGMTTSPAPDSLPGTTASQASQLHPVFLSPLQLNTDTRVSGLRCQKPHYICLFSLPIVVIPVNMFGESND